MAPRKLIIAMLVLLGFSTGLAVFAPDPPRPERQVVEAEPEPEQPTPDRTARNPNQGSDSGASRTTDSPGTRRVAAAVGKPVKDLSATPGERIVLAVESGRTSVIEIDGLGLTGVSTRYAPANFDLLLPDRSGRYTVREQGGRRILVISVSGGGD